PRCRRATAAMTFRPHQVHIRAPGAPTDASRLWLDGIVESTEFLGEVSRYKLRVGQACVVADEVHYAGEPVLAPGAAVRLGIDPAQVRFLTV
ncbi:MAG: TOBE domain-containing protein, partial [Comamonadaceae bacterium]